MKSVLVAISLLAVLITTALAQQITVSPSSVNAYSQGSTTAFLTYGGLTNKRPVDACWCGELMPAAPDIGFKCNPATVFGCLPVRYNQSRLSGNSAYTDVMSIPSSVARRAYLDAASGAESTFFYVRRFASTVGGLDEFVPVTIRLSGSGAGVPFSLADVKLSFAGDKPVLLVKAGEKLPPIRAEITYTGTGRLKGRWELVKPGDEPPSDRDLLTEGSLPVEERVLRRRYAELSRFNVYLPPTGKYVLPGPETWRLQNPVEGVYLVLLRIEATDNGDGNSDLGAVGAGPAVANSGAAAGFPIPGLRYYVGADGGGNRTVDQTPASVSLISPADNAIVRREDRLEFRWSEMKGAALYRLEVETSDGASVLSAMLLSGVAAYRAPSWLREKRKADNLRWRVVVLDRTGTPIEQTSWRAFRL